MSRPIESLDEWIETIAAEADQAHRRRSNFIAKNLSRTRTVLRIVRDLGIRDATRLIVSELRR